MKISELIQKLQELKKDFGDIEFRLKYVKNSEIYSFK